MWVSKPGKSAASTDPTDLLVDTNRTLLRPILAGVITNPVLNYDTNNFHAPSRSDEGTFTIVGTTGSDGNTVYSSAYGNIPITISSGGSVNSDGVAVYYKDYFYKSDHTSLGYVPLTHISIGSSTAGDNYPKIQIDDTKIRLIIYQNWDGSVNQNEGKLIQTYYPGWTTGLYNLHYYYPSNNSNKSKDFWQAPVNGPTPSTSFQTNCTIHYAVYARAMSLP